MKRKISSKGDTLRSICTKWMIFGSHLYVEPFIFSPFSKIIKLLRMAFFHNAFFWIVGCWEDWVKSAYFSRISLSSTGTFIKKHNSPTTPDLLDYFFDYTCSNWLFFPIFFSLLKESLWLQFLTKKTLNLTYS